MADALMAVTRHQRMSLPSASIIDPVLVPFQVAGGSPGWQVAGASRKGRDCHHVRGRTDMGMVGDLARLVAHTSANGGHGNDRPAQGRNTFGSQVSAAGYLVRVFRFRCRCGWKVSCHLSSVIDSVIYPSLCLSLSANR